MARKKKEVIEEVEDIIIDGDIIDAVTESMSEYSKYVLTSRAIPDVRDGFIPVL